MRCSRCNSKNRGSAKRCSKCGAALMPAGKSTTREMHERYTIKRALGKGGMGTIYLASETIAGRERQVVIKEMLDYYDPQDAQAKAKARKRFEGEAATLVALNVSGVPQIFDYFSEGERNYIVMQFIEGQNLETRLTHVDDNDDIVNGRPYPVEQVRRWGMKLCKILEALAEQGILHLDIKPANLILDKSGDIWLVDFGTAKAQRGGQQGFKPAPQKTGFKPGLQKTSIYGTLGYAPPEQVAGRPEARSDVYALAATLYHLMTDDDPGSHPDDFPELDRLPGPVAAALRRALTTSVKKRVKGMELRRLLDVQSGRSPVFHWRSGAVSADPTNLVELADNNWGEALAYFKGDAWEKWFRDLYRNDLADQLKLIKAQHGKGSPGMDVFLRSLDPNYPLPGLHLPVSAFDVGKMSWGTKRTLDLELINTGGGCLQGSFVNLPPGVQAAPLSFATHERKLIKITVNTRSLTPSSKVQTLYLTLDAGSSGRKQVPLKVRVPEPELSVKTAELDLGNIYPGEISGDIIVRNPGDSEYVGAAHSSSVWVSVQPRQFRCQPGGERKLKVRADGSSLHFGRHVAQIEISARAGGWQQAEKIAVSLGVSFAKVFWKHWAPPIVWVIGWTIYGGIVGFLLSQFSASMGGILADKAGAVLTGVLFAALICVIPGLFIGLLGGIGGQGGGDGGRRGAVLGLIVGAITGVVGSYLALRLIPVLGLDLNAVQVLKLFGSLVGVFAGAVLGLVLWLLTPGGFYSF